MGRDGEWAPAGFCYGKKLQFSDCKASCAVGSARLLLGTQTSGKASHGPKMQYHPPKYAGVMTATSPPVPVSATGDHGGFLQRACLHLSRLKQTLYYLAVLSDPSQESKLTDGRSLPLYEQEGRLVVVAWQRQRPGAGHSEMLAKSALLTQRSGRVLRDGKATRLTAPSHAFAAQITGDTAYVTPGTKSKQQCLTSLASSYVAAARLREFG